jgi:hypothetical protein
MANYTGADGKPLFCGTYKTVAAAQTASQLSARAMQTTMRSMDTRTTVFEF